jgi:hypothetical protein
MWLKNLSGYKNESETVVKCKHKKVQYNNSSRILEHRRSELDLDLWLIIENNLSSVFGSTEFIPANHLQQNGSAAGTIPVAHNSRGGSHFSHHFSFYCNLLWRRRLLWSSRVSYSNLACFFSPIVSQFSWFSILILFAGLLRVLILLKSRKHTTNSPWNSTSLSFCL